MPVSPRPPAPSVPPPDAVLFDLDGTLVDTVPNRIEAWSRAFAEFGLPASRDQLAPLIGIDGRRLAREVAAAAGVPIDAELEEAIDRRCGVIYEGLNRDPRALPGAGELIAALEHRGISWAIATSSRREQVATSVTALGLSREPAIVDGSHVRHAKPEPDLLLLGADRLAIAPARCWYVGDSTWDMLAAVAAGMIAIGVTAGAAADAGVLERAGARLVVPTLGDLVGQLGTAHS